MPPYNSMKNCRLKLSTEALEAEQSSYINIKIKLSQKRKLYLNYRSIKSQKKN